MVQKWRWWCSRWLCGWFELIWESAVGGGYIGVADGWGMSVRDGGEGNKGSAVMSGGGGACAGSGGVSGRNCCRLPEVIQELWEDLPYSFPFFFKFYFNKVVSLVSLERKR